MNRTERRKLAKQGYSQKSIMSQYRSDAYEQGFTDGIKHTQTVVMMMTAYALHTHLGLGKKRLPEIMHWIQEDITSFETGHLTVDDIPAIKEELKQCGCEFKLIYDR